MDLSFSSYSEVNLKPIAPGRRGHATRFHHGPMHKKTPSAYAECDSVIMDNKKNPVHKCT